MKRLLTIAVALVLGSAAVMFTGCGAHNGTVIYPNSMSAVIGSVLSFTSTGSDITASKVNGTLTMVAKSPTNAKITITVPSFNAAPSTTLAITDIALPAGAVYDSLGNGVVLNAARGTLVFNKVSPYLEGTFTFVCSDSTTVTNGTFKVRAPK